MPYSIKQFLMLHPICPKPTKKGTSKKEHTLLFTTCKKLKQNALGPKSYVPCNCQVHCQLGTDIAPLNSHISVV